MLQASASKFCIISLSLFLLFRTITNVEEHIKNAFISESGISDSTYRNMKIDIDTIEIKRQLDPEILQKAAFIYEQVKLKFSAQASIIQF